MANHGFDSNAVVLKHRLGSRLFHWALILGFLPAALTGFIIWLKPGSEDFVGLAMQIHIIGAWILTIGSALYTLFCFDRIVAFLRGAFHWTQDDIKWLAVGGGYPQKMFLNKEIPVPAMGKMNSGQKMFGVCLFIGGIILILTGWLLYAYLPMIPKDIAKFAHMLHLVIGIGLALFLVFGHIAMALYNWGECVCMFGDGTMKVSEAMHHNELWVKNQIEPAPNPTSTSTVVTK